MSRLYHALVVMGAGLSVWSCGKGESTDEQEAGGSANDEGGAAAAGSEKAGAGGSRGGGSSGGGPVVVTGGAPSTCEGSTLPQQCLTPAEPNPQLPASEVTAQWDCSALFVECVEPPADGTCPPVFRISEPCPLDPSRPTTAADCDDDQVFECLLATLGDTPVIVNCQCSLSAQTSRTSCIDVEYKLDAPVVDCSEGRKLCGCAYSGILVE